LEQLRSAKLSPHIVPTVADRNKATAALSSKLTAAVPYPKVDPLFDCIRRNRRYQKIGNRIGLASRTRCKPGFLNSRKLVAMAGFEPAMTRLKAG
jgi:hypothetical protein